MKTVVPIVQSLDWFLVGSLGCSKEDGGVVYAPNDDPGLVGLIQPGLIKPGLIQPVGLMVPGVLLNDRPTDVLVIFRLARLISSFIGRGLIDPSITPII